MKSKLIPLLSALLLVSCGSYDAGVSQKDTKTTLNTIETKSVIDSVSEESSITTASSTVKVTTIKSETTTTTSITEKRIEASDNQAAEKELPDYEVTNQMFEIYNRNNEESDISYKGIIEITNTGNTNLFLGDCRFTLEDDNGHLLYVDNTIYAAPDVIAPGETGYLYNSSDLPLRNVNTDNGVCLVPEFNISKTKNPADRYAVEDTDLREDEYSGIIVSGRSVNTTDQAAPFALVSVILYDDADNIIDVAATGFSDVKPGDSNAFEAHMVHYKRDTNPINDVQSYAVIAAKRHYSP